MQVRLVMLAKRTCHISAFDRLKVLKDDVEIWQV
jgi:hypothetical protein